MDYETRVEPAEPMVEDNDPIEIAVGDAFAAPATDESTSPRKRLLTIGALALIAIIAIGLYVVRGHGGEKTDTSHQLPTVSVVVPGQQQVEGTINATGTLAAQVDMPVGIAGEGGQVLSVLVQPGQWVNRGQVLAVIDRSVQVQQEASQAAQVVSARAQAEIAQSNYNRALQLVDRGFISKADLEQLRATRDAAAAQVKVASAQLGVLKAQSARLNVVAPEPGLILERKVEPGQVVSSGSGTLFRMAKGGEMELRAQLSENDLARLSNGETAKVTPVGSDQGFTGRIWQLAPVIDPTTRQGIARIALPYDIALRPGGFASAVLHSGLVTAPMLPQSAIQNDSNGSFVFVVGPDSRVRRVSVKLGQVTDSGIAIAEGLHGDEKIVLRAGGFLNPGDQVIPRLLKAGE